MINSLIQDISRTLKIDRYSVESDKEYIGRVVLSAILEWGRTLILSDICSRAEEKEIHEVDKVYLNYRLTKVIEGYRNVFDCDNYLGISNDECSEFVSDIIRLLINCYQISELEESRRLSNPPICFIRFDQENILVNGAYDLESKSIGFGKWINKDIDDCDYEFRHFFNISKYNYSEYFTQYCRSVENGEPLESLSDKNLELMHNELGYISYEKFSLIELLDLKPGCYILRHSVKNYSCMYIYIVTGSKRQVHMLDETMFQTREIRRLSYSYRAIYAEKQKIYKSVYGDCVVLKSLNFLPEGEQKIINLSTWGKKSYNDKDRIVPLELWGTVECMLKDLGLEIINI